LTHPRSKSASLAITVSLEGIEGVVEGSVFVRLFEAVNWLFMSHTKDSKLAISKRAKNTLFRMANLHPVFGCNCMPEDVNFLGS
jgi:hypothetical protein